MLQSLVFMIGSGALAVFTYKRYVENRLGHFGMELAACMFIVYCSINVCVVTNSTWDDVNRNMHDYTALYRTLCQGTAALSGSKLGDKCSDAHRYISKSVLATIIDEMHKRGFANIMLNNSLWDTFVSIADGSFGKIFVFCALIAMIFASLGCCCLGSTLINRATHASTQYVATAKERARMRAEIMAQAHAKQEEEMRDEAAKMNKQKLLDEGLPIFVTNTKKTR